MRTAFGLHLSSSDRTALTLPSDFDIFSPPTVTIPTCIHALASGAPPECASDWAISFSWWGNTRSRPPPCRSIVSPRYRRHIAEHSMCQPGLPLPQGLGQDGSPDENFQSAKSRGSRFAPSTATLAPALRLPVSLPDSLPYPARAPTEKYTPVSAT